MEQTFWQTKAAEKVSILSTLQKIAHFTSYYVYEKNRGGGGLWGCKMTR